MTWIELVDKHMGAFWTLAVIALVISAICLEELIEAWSKRK